MGIIEINEWDVDIFVECERVKRERDDSICSRAISWAMKKQENREQQIRGKAKTQIPEMLESLQHPWESEIPTPLIVMREPLFATCLTQV